MRRKRGGYVLSLWQFAILAVLYTDAEVQSIKIPSRARFYWIEWEQKIYRINSRTIYSLLDYKLVRQKTRTKCAITKMGKKVVEALTEEEITALRTVFPLHDMRITPTGDVFHMGTTLQELLDELNDQ